MAKTFYYDSNDIFNATLNDGSLSSSNFADGTTITNEERATDQSIATAVTAFTIGDLLLVDYGSAVINDFAALYFTELNSTDVTIRDSDDGTATSVNTTQSSNLVAGWNVIHLTSESHRYWLLQAGNGTLTGLTEMILGARLEFSINPDIGISEQEIFGTAVNRSAGGVEYAVKKHNPISTWTLNFANISSTFKASLQSMEAEVQDYKKFLWYDETNYHYVRLESPIKYTEVAYQRYSASISLREQLS